MARLRIDSADLAIYLTDTLIQNISNGPRGVNLSRNVEFYSIGVDPYKNPQLIINTTMRRVGMLGVEGAHEDLIQFQDNTKENVIVYGLTAVEDIRARVAAHHAAGADHVCVQVLPADQRALPMAEWRELAPALLS